MLQTVISTDAFNVNWGLRARYVGGIVYILCWNIDSVQIQHRYKLKSLASSSTVLQ